jgi:hypothetical protein
MAINVNTSEVVSLPVWEKLCQIQEQMLSLENRLNSFCRHLKDDGIGQDPMVHSEFYDKLADISDRLQSLLDRMEI